MDINGDGKLDILSGSYSTTMNGVMTGLFHVLYGQIDGTFALAEVLKGTDGEPLTIPAPSSKQHHDRICTRPFAVDFDGDGQLDLVVGNFAGTFYWFKGQGSGQFQPKPTVIRAEDELLRIPGEHSDPFVIDWDGDGDLDIVSGCIDGGVYWAENKAGKGQMPVFTSFHVLIPANPNVEGDHIVLSEDLTRPMLDSRIWVADVNGDRKLDLLVGDTVHLAIPAEGISTSDCRNQLAEWNDQVNHLQEILNGEQYRLSDRMKAGTDLMQLRDRRKRFMTDQNTGFVWLYLRK